MKLLFLDFDGVMVKPGTGYFDPVAVANLNSITDATGAFIVVSSDWRRTYQHAIADLRAMMKSNGITGLVRGITACDDQSRIEQIERYESNRWPQDEDDDYLVLDDLDLDYGMFQIIIDGSKLLTSDDAAKAISIFNKGRYFNKGK